MKRFFIVTYVTLYKTEIKDDMVTLGNIFPTTSTHDTLEQAVSAAKLEDTKGSPVTVKTITDPNNSAYSHTVAMLDKKDTPFSNVPAGRFVCEYNFNEMLPTTVLTFISYNAINV